MEQKFSMYDLVFELPLYTTRKWNEENSQELYKLLNNSFKVDAYNPNLKERTTYLIYLEKDRAISSIGDFVGFNTIKAICQRRQDEIDVFIHLSEEDSFSDDEYIGTVYTLKKIGQLPSIADLHISRIRTYDKVLPKEKIREFTRAIGLAANGVGIGSFVYLRRIFEYLIDDAYQTARTDSTWKNELFYEKRMDEKIEILRNYLPLFLVENKIIYSVLSKGIHELEEQECLQYFEPLKVAIELILDEKVEKKIKEDKLADAGNKIQGILQKLNSKL